MANIEVSNSIVVDAAIDEVFHAFNDPETMPEWFSTDMEIRGYSPPLEVGKTYESVATFMGREVSSNSTIIAIEPPNSLRMRASGMVSGDVEHAFKEVDGGTQVTIHFVGDMGGFFATLAAPLIRAQINNQMQNDLESFKTYIENKT